MVILNLLRQNEWTGSSTFIEFAKGSNELPLTRKEKIYKLKRRVKLWLLRRI